MITLGLCLHRVDIAVMAAPFVLAPALLYESNAQAPRVRVALERREVVEREPAALAVRLECDEDLDAVEIVLQPGRFEPAGSMHHFIVALRVGERRSFKLELEAARWGRVAVGPVRVTARPAGLLGEVRSIRVAPLELQVFPSAETFRAMGAVPDTLVTAGEHRTLRIGTGLEIANVRPFVSGDRLRRINWRATSRRGELHVTSTFAERSAQVQIVIDAAHDPGPSGTSALDVAVRAAAAIAEHYLALGDLVELAEYGYATRYLDVGTGRRQLARAQRWLLDVGASSGRRPPTGHHWLEGARLGRGLVVILTPLLDAFTATELVVLRSRGASVVAIDTLGADVRPPNTDPVDALAAEIWLLQREMLIARLAELGVPIVPWAGSRSLDAVLTDLAKMAAAPRLAVR